jgi:hypothetical protein
MKANRRRLDRIEEVVPILSGVLPPQREGEDDLLYTLRTMRLQGLRLADLLQLSRDLEKKQNEEARMAGLQSKVPLEAETPELEERPQSDTESSL